MLNKTILWQRQLGRSKATVWSDLKHICDARTQAMATKRTLLGWRNMFSTSWLPVLVIRVFVLPVGWAGRKPEAMGQTFPFHQPALG